MKLVTFSSTDQTTERVGLLSNGGIVDLSQVAPDLPRDMLALIEGHKDSAAALEERFSAYLQHPPHYEHGHFGLHAPIGRPPKIIAIGLNYRAHAEESNMQIPSVPLVFTKQSTSVTGPNDPIYWSQDSKALDYEGELAIVIGKRCRRVPKDRARDVILGYTVLNDVSVRDWQLRGTPPSFTMGKSWDSHCPIGPAITVDTNLDPHTLTLTTHVNGELRQSTCTDDLIFDCFELVEFLSTAFTLEPGDIIATGTPSGVGFANKPPKVLAPGDVVTVQIESLGTIENTVAEEPENLACFF